MVRLLTVLGCALRRRHRSPGWQWRRRGLRIAALRAMGPHRGDLAVMGAGGAVHREGGPGGGSRRLIAQHRPFEADPRVGDPHAGEVGVVGHQGPEQVQGAAAVVRWRGAAAGIGDEAGRQGDGLSPLPAEVGAVVGGIEPAGFVLCLVQRETVQGDGLGAVVFQRVDRQPQLGRIEARDHRIAIELGRRSLGQPLGNGAVEGKRLQA